MNDFVRSKTVVQPIKIKVSYPIIMQVIGRTKENRPNCISHPGDMNALAQNNIQKQVRGDKEKR